MSAHLIRVSPAVLDVVWPTVARDIESAMAYCKDDTLLSVRTELEQGAAQLWLARVNGVQVGCVVTEMQETAARKILEIRYLAGSRLKEWIQCQRHLEIWATAHGCSALRIRGRRGWVRILPKEGWKETSVEMERALA